MKKTVITFIFTFTILSGIMFADYLVNNNFIMVKTEPVLSKEMNKYINATGICQEQNKREIRVDLPLYVDKIYVNVGDKIQRGQKVLKLNKESFENRLELQSVTVSSVNNDNLIAKINNFNEEITSPINGVVTKLNVCEGAEINISTPVMVISDLDNLVIKASVPENIISDIYVGQTVLISNDSLYNKVKGEVIKIHPVGEKKDMFSSQSFITVDVIANDYESIRPETTLNLEFLKNEKKKNIIIPFDAVMFDEENPYVFIDNLGYAVKRYVNLGEEYDIEVEVLSGIKEGDKLILNPKINKIKEGDKILKIE
ncbi:MAG: HlyD family efflux transporter periplasmic adaptor subunit [Ruminococcaceae bacterium]|nr:HlyD family efflux transporter periplasmic adaptor subunit [Oscillospiraceae bacterium]